MATSNTIRFQDDTQATPVDIVLRAIKAADGSYTLELGQTFFSAGAGAGDAQSIYNATTAQLLGVSRGTAASPDTSINPLLKATRLITIAESAIGGDGAEQLASIVGISVGAAACEVQPVGVFGGAKTSSTAGAPGNDACGLYGVGQALSGATGVGIGGFFSGRRESDSGKLTGVEVVAANFGTSDVPYSSTGYSGAHGIWMNANGNADSAAGLTISNAFGRQFDVGIAFTAQVTGGKTGGVKTTTIRDDGNATNSIIVDGTHTIGLAIDSGAGYGVLGALARLSSTALFEVVAPTSGGLDPLVQFGQATNAQSYSVVLRNGSAVSRWFVSGASNAFVTGTIAGDAGVAVPSGFAYFIGRAGPGASIVTARNNAGASELGFFAATTAAKQTVTGSRGGNAALASLLTALAAYGLVTDSTSA